MSFQFSKHVEEEAARRGIPWTTVEAVLARAHLSFLESRSDVVTVAVSSQPTERGLEGFHVA